MQGAEKVELNNFKLVTSNENKLNEFKRFGLKNLQIEKGIDLREIDASPKLVAIYKAKDAGKGKIIEDTSLFVDEENIGTNVRWLMENLGSSIGKRATWQVILGINDGDTISIFQSSIHGTMTKATEGVKGFGFDLMFVPDGAHKSLGELEQMGLKDLCSARRMAVEKMIKGEPDYVLDIKNLQPWVGSYQNE